MSAETVVKRQFRIHPQMLYDAMLRQAGTLGKAVLEGAMNSVDAKATKCDITLTSHQLTITDDGIGFTSAKQIADNFEEFGRPHDENEHKTFGVFRMGRGQLFAFGINNWHSSNFRMEKVDIKTTGLEYDLHENGQVFPGCKVVVNLYRPMLPSQKAEVETEIERLVRYFSIPITLNGKLISKPPAKLKWDETTEDAYMKFNDGQVLSVYNLGAHVRDFPASTFGIGGVIVSRQQLAVNFPRNDIMTNDCEVWKRIRKTVDKYSKDKAKKTPVLNDSQRYRLCKQLLHGEIDVSEILESRIFTDVTGRHWSMSQLRSAFGKFQDTYSEGDRYARDADLVHRHVKSAFVFAKETLERFDFDTAKELVEWLREIDPNPYGWNVYDGNYVPLHRLSAGLNLEKKILTDKDLTKGERLVLKCLQGWNPMMRILECPERRVMLGESSDAGGWTDGVSFIALNREGLTKKASTIGGWMEIGRIMLHEYCHMDSSIETHTHSPEFYQLFHDNIHAAFEFAENRFMTYVRALESEFVRNKKLLRTTDKVVRLTAAVVAVEQQREKIEAQAQ